MGAFFWIVLGIIVLGYIVDVIAKFRKDSKIDNEPAEEATESTFESLFEEDVVDTEDPLYNMNSGEQIKDSSIADSLTPKKVYVAPMMEVREDSKVEGVRFDLRQAVICQAILQNDYIDNRN